MISIVIPTYNEKDNIIKLIESIKKIGKQKKLKYEIIVVDDSSPDGTGLLVRKIYKNNRSIRCFIRHSHRGLAQSILYGISNAKGKIIIGMDADFNHPPVYVDKLVDALKAKKGKLIIASRFVKGGSMHGFLRPFGSKIVNYLLRYFFRFPLYDNLSGYYAIYLSDLKKMGLQNIYSGYGEYHMRLVWFAHYLHGYSIFELPAKCGKRYRGVSKSDLLGMLVGYFHEAWKLNRSLTNRDR